MVWPTLVVLQVPHKHNVGLKAFSIKLEHRQLLVYSEVKRQAEKGGKQYHSEWTSQLFSNVKNQQKMNKKTLIQGVV